ncbi:hypothetical protein J6590_085286 [Homalodisca vitripennis]|nr:hypothetical protein J6590_085286 [Homalodisca vitripennis]
MFTILFPPVTSRVLRLPPVLPSAMPIPCCVCDFLRDFPPRLIHIMKPVLKPNYGKSADKGLKFAIELNVSCGSAFTIINDILGVSKVSARWLPETSPRSCDFLLGPVAPL